MFTLLFNEFLSHFNIYYRHCTNILMCYLVFQIKNKAVLHEDNAKKDNFPLTRHLFNDSTLISILMNPKFSLKLFNFHLMRKLVKNEQVQSILLVTKHLRKLRLSHNLVLFHLHIENPTDFTSCIQNILYLEH